VDPKDAKYAKVEYFILDPSCSGSGIVSRMDALLDESPDAEIDQERLNALADFQVSIIEHAIQCRRTNIGPFSV
jgi:putative methyltransferase